MPISIVPQHQDEKELNNAISSIFSTFKLGDVPDIYVGNILVNHAFHKFLKSLTFKNFVSIAIDFVNLILSSNKIP